MSELQEKRDYYSNITVDELKFYSEYIPFKYFYIEKNGEIKPNKKLIIG